MSCVSLSVSVCDPPGMCVPVAHVPSVAYPRGRAGMADGCVKCMRTRDFQSGNVIQVHVL